MKFLIVVSALVACALAGPVREKRGFLSGLHSADVYSDYSPSLVSLSSPVAEIVSVNKIVDSHHVVDVPQVVNVPKVVSVPQVVSVNKLVALPNHSSFSSGHDYGYESGWSSGIYNGW